MLMNKFYLLLSIPRVAQERFVCIVMAALGQLNILYVYLGVNK